VEIIWIDRPVSLPTRSLKYQRSEVAPLPHDSPLREHIDMIIWNKPTPPRFLGWKSPILEYVRLIEQDTPTTTGPYSSLLFVPHLQGWGRRFRANSTQGRNITEQEIMEHAYGPKYARGTVSDSGFSIDLNDTELQGEIIRESLMLSPCILRPRAGYENGTQLVKSSLSPIFKLEKTELEKIKPSRGILDRLSFVPDGRPLQSTRWNQDNSGQYYPATSITRAILHKKKRVSEEQDRWTRRPPLLEAPREVKIDEERLLAEIRRILRTSRFLRRKAMSANLDWKEFLSKITKICVSALKMSEHEKKAIDALVDIKTVLSKNKESKETWGTLKDIRKKMLDNAFLSSSTVDVTNRLATKDCELWEIFGNDLYLLILAISWDDTIGVKKSNLEILWSAFSDWQLVHLGFMNQERPKTHVKSKYDISAIWTNLNWRSRKLASSSMPIGLVESNQFGYIIEVDTEHHWLVFQERSTPRSMLAGLFDNPDGTFRWKWYGCITDPFHLELWSNESWSTFTPIVITHIEGRDILWTGRQDDEITEWWAEGIFEYGYSSQGKTTPIRWFKLSKIPDTLRERLVQPDTTIPEELEESAKYALQQLGELSDGVILVDCHVTIDVDTETYQVSFFDKGVKEKKPLYTLGIESTIELIQTLRYPKLKGEPLKEKFWWNPESDIKYSSVETQSGPVSLTFIKPFIYRDRKRSELLKSLRLPQNAKQLLQTTIGNTITLVADPNLSYAKNPLSKMWNILFLQIETSEKMLALQRINLDIIEVAQFFEGDQFIDMATQIRYPLEFTINKLKNATFVHDVFRYHRIKAILNEKGVYEDNDDNSLNP